MNRRSRVSPSSALPRRKARTNTTTLSKPSRARPPRPGVVGARTSARGARCGVLVVRKRYRYKKHIFFRVFFSPRNPFNFWAFAQARARSKERERESVASKRRPFDTHHRGSSLLERRRKHLRGFFGEDKDVARARRRTRRHNQSEAAKSR